MRIKSLHGDKRTCPDVRLIRDIVVMQQKRGDSELICCVNRKPRRQLLADNNTIRAACVGE